MNGRKKVMVLLPQGYEDLEAASFIDVLGWVNVTSGPLAAVDIVGCDPEVTSAMGLRVIPARVLSDVNPDDYVAVALPGGYHNRGYRQAYDQAVLDTLARIHRRGGIVATICVGALPAATAGLLCGLAATTYPLDDGRHESELRRLGAIPTGQRIESSGRVITGNGPGAALAVALELASALFGQETAEKTAQLMMLEVSP